MIKLLGKIRRVMQRLCRRSSKYRASEEILYVQVDKRDFVGKPRQGKISLNLTLDTKILEENLDILLEKACSGSLSDYTIRQLASRLNQKASLIKFAYTPKERPNYHALADKFKSTANEISRYLLQSEPATSNRLSMAA